jgi:5-formyltetrahydrofolate cyclo-ligase
VDLPARKARLRAEMAERRKRLAPAEAARAAQAVAGRVRELPAFRRARVVALYAALADELPSRPLFEAVRAAGKEALLPRTDGDSLAFCRVDAWEELVPGRYGVAEPPSGRAAVAPPGLVIVPGVAFDRAGHRLGRGEGYYDRAFAAAETAGLLVGVGYAFQLLDKVPHGPHDRRMDGVVTDAGQWWAREEGEGEGA